MYRIIGTDQKEYGPVSRETILQWISEGRATVQSWVRAEGTSGWRRLGSLPEFVAAFSGNQPALTDRPPVAACRPVVPVVAVRRTNPLATASLIMGLLAVTCGCCCCYGFPFNLLGVLFAALALTQIHRAPEVESGRELAIAGLVLCLVSLGLSVVMGLFSALAAWPELAREMRRW
jgi:hypothetical protein